MLQDMIDAQIDEKRNRYQTMQNTKFKSGVSISDETRFATDELFQTIGKPMKKIKAAYLLDVAKNCYPDKWMRPDMPNEPQVELCHLETKDKYFKNWEQELIAVRDSNKFRMVDCFQEAEGNMADVSRCMEAYKDGMFRDNKQLTDFFK